MRRGFSKNQILYWGVYLLIFTAWSIPVVRVYDPDGTRAFLSILNLWCLITIMGGGWLTHTIGAMLIRRWLNSRARSAPGVLEKEE